MKWPPCCHGLNPNNALRIFSLRPLAAIYCYHILMNVSSSICFPHPILPYLTAVVGFLPMSCTHSTYVPDFPTICTLLSSLLHSPFTSPLNLFINAILLDTCGTFWREVPRFHPYTTATGGTTTRHDSGKGQQGDRMHDNCDRRHDDNKGQQGNRRHDNQQRRDDEGQGGATKKAEPAVQR